MQLHILLVGPKLAHLQTQIEEWGYAVSSVSKGQDAFDVLSIQAVPVILFDLSIASPSAQAFVQHVRKQQPNCQLLLIEETSKAGQIVRVIQDGVHLFMAAPPRETVLYNNLTQLVDQFSRQSLDVTETHLVRERLAQTQQQVLELGMQNDLLHQEIESLRKQGNTEANLETDPIQDHIENDSILDELEQLGAAKDTGDESTSVALALVSEEETRRLLQEAKRHVDQISALENELEEALKERDLSKARAESAKADVLALETALSEKLTQLSKAHTATENIAEQQKLTRGIIQEALEESESVRSLLTSELAKTKRALKKAKESQALQKLEYEESIVRLSYWENRAKKAEHILKKIAMEQALRKKQKKNAQ